MADTNNIYQRAIDIFNKHVEPDISQGGGGSGGPKYMHKISMQALSQFNHSVQFGESDTRTCKFLVALNFMVELPFEEEFNEFEKICYMINDGFIKNPIVGMIDVLNPDNMEEKYTTVPIIGVSYVYNDQQQLQIHYSVIDWSKGQIKYTYTAIVESDQMVIRDTVEEIEF